MRRSLVGLAAVLLVSAGGTAAPATAPTTAPSTSASPTPTPSASAAPCAGVDVVGTSEALDDVTVGDAEVTGLSSLAWDPVTGRWRTATDRDDDNPAHVWSFSDLDDPVVDGPPLVLTRPDGTPYTGEDSDDEGLAVLPDGRLVVSSETEPSVRVFGADGRQQQELPVPQRFLVAPAGQAHDNGTLEGLTVTPDGLRLVAAMELTLSGDTGDGSYRRFLVWDRASLTAPWTLTEQVGYRVDPGSRVPEVAALGHDELLVLESSVGIGGFDPRIYRVTLQGAVDVSGEPDLAATGQVVAKTLAADLGDCGPVALRLANLEGLGLHSVTDGVADLGLVSDDGSGLHTVVVHLRLRVSG